MHHAMRALYIYNVDRVMNTISKGYSSKLLGPQWSDARRDKAFDTIYIASIQGLYGNVFSSKSDPQSIQTVISSQGFHVSAFSSIQVHSLNTAPGQDPLGERIEDAEVQWIPLPLPLEGR